MQENSGSFTPSSYLDPRNLAMALARQRKAAIAVFTLCLLATLGYERFLVEPLFASRGTLAPVLRTDLYPLNTINRKVIGPHRVLVLVASMLESDAALQHALARLCAASADASTGSNTETECAHQLQESTRNVTVSLQQTSRDKSLSQPRVVVSVEARSAAASSRMLDALIHSANELARTALIDSLMSALTNRLEEVQEQQNRPEEHVATGDAEEKQRLRDAYELEREAAVSRLEHLMAADYSTLPVSRSLDPTGEPAQQLRPRLGRAGALALFLAMALAIATAVLLDMFRLSRTPEQIPGS